MTSEDSTTSELDGAKGSTKPYSLRRQGVECPDSWQVYELIDVFEIEYGKSLPKEEREQGPFPVFGSNGRSGWHSDYHVDAPGIIIGRKGVNLGIEWSNDDFNVIDTAYFANSKSIKIPDIELKFLYYNLLDFDLDRLKSGSAVPGLNRDDFYDQTIALPPLEEQRKISRILTNIDNKIEENKTQSKLLIELAQTVFTNWFVDFKPYDNFRESEIGKIPKKFDLALLEDVLSLQRGYSYSGDELIDEESDLDPEDGYPMVNLGNVSPGGGYRPENIKYCIEPPKDRYLTSPGDLIISHTDMTQDKGILGSPVIVPELDNEPILFSHHLYAVQESELPNEYLYYYFLSPYFKPKAENFASGTTVLSFSSKITSDVHIPVPPIEDLNEFLKLASPAFERIESVRKENEMLNELRDTLLPRLMSGELRVNNINVEELMVNSEV